LDEIAKTFLVKNCSSHILQNVFKQFDEDGSGSFSILQLRLALNHAG